MIDPKEIARLITENPDVPAIPGEGSGGLAPEQFVNAVGSLIASAPHGRQQEVLKKLTEIGAQDPGTLTNHLLSVEPVHAPQYLVDFLKVVGLTLC